MTKKLFVTIFLLLLFSIFSGCSPGDSSNSNTETAEDQRLARIEVYSANEQTLIDTIENKETLAAFSKSTSFTDQLEDIDDDYMEQQAEIQKKLEKYEPQYVFISYKTPAAINNDGALEKILKITVYKDTNIIKVQISPDNVKNCSVPSEYLTFCFQASDKEIAYLYSLVQ
ncbi:hypothetical protein [Aminipila sp.]|uniref:hypothetical protein n=1 Tax=Aminipila sp. TaxID=2060095 RepID=UPI00289CF7A0|nr:hypothetical protein [Aminipila sp.]